MPLSCFLPGKEKIILPATNSPATPACPDTRGTHHVLKPIHREVRPDVEDRELPHRGRLRAGGDVQVAAFGGVHRVAPYAG